ncbi:hypothetical protein Tco_1046626 [Tanacetum coccineum]
MFNRHQELASPEQTASDKDFLNPLMADSLPKTIWVINAPCYYNKALPIPEQTATGKEISNPFMAGRHKDKVSMQIPDWMITEEMKHKKRAMYIFMRSPTPKKDTTESSAPKRSTVIRFRLPERRSTRLTPPAPMPTVDKVDEMILQDTLQVSLAEQKVEKSKKARENWNWSTNTNDEEVEITNVVIPVNVNEEEDEITDEVYELKRREKGKIIKESRSTPFPTPIRSPRTHTNLVSSDTEKLQELMVTHTQTASSSRSQHTKLSRANRLLSLFKAKPARFKRY